MYCIYDSRTGINSAKYVFYNRIFFTQHFIYMILHDFSFQIISILI